MSDRLSRLTAPVTGLLFVGLTLAGVHLRLVFMGDRSPKATSKQAAQKRAKADSASQKKKEAASAKQVPKTKK